MNKPNLFIIGAPKSGTSALAAYLDEHPNVFISNPKEPFFWSTDYPALRARHHLSCQSDYLQLFTQANDQHMLVGECSTNYLRSKVAIDNVLEFNPQAKFIVMLRNPVQVAHAFHAECLFSYIEREPSFEEDWRLQTARASGKQLPANCSAPQFLQYGQVASYADQIQQFFDRVPQSQRQVILYDDFRLDNAGVFQDVIEFLQLPEFQKTEFQRVNAAHVHRSRFVAKLILDPPAILKPSVEWLRQMLRSQKKNSWKTQLKQKFRKSEQREPLSDAFQNELYEYFRDDVKRLAKMLGRDLDHWMSPQQKQPVRPAKPSVESVAMQSSVVNFQSNV